MIIAFPFKIRSSDFQLQLWQSPITTLALENRRYDIG